MYKIENNTGLVASYDEWLKYNDESKITVTLTKQEYAALNKLISKELSDQERNSPEKLIERAIALKTKAKELYPKKEFEVSVYNGNIDFKCVVEDSFWSRVSSCQILLEVVKALDDKTDRIYV